MVLGAPMALRPNGSNRRQVMPLRGTAKRAAQSAAKVRLTALVEKHRDELCVDERGIVHVCCKRFQHTIVVHLERFCQGQKRRR